MTAAAVAFVAAVQDGSWSDVEARLAPGAVLLLPSGERFTGREAVAGAIRAAAGAPGRYVFRFEGARTRECTGALHGTGILSARQNEPGGQEIGVWHISAIWERTEPGAGPLRLRSANVYGADGWEAYLERACAPLPDSLFATRRFAVLLAPGATQLVSDAYTVRFDEALGSTGWANPALFGGSGPRRGTSTPALGAATLRYHFNPSFYAAASLAAFGGSSQRGNPLLGRAGFDYDGYLAAGQAGIQHGWLFAAAGPAYLRLAGDWHTLEEYGGRAPAAPESASGWALGLLGEGGLLVPLTESGGLALHAQHRYLPAVELAGYRNSSPFRVDYSHSALLVSAVVRF